MYRSVGNLALNCAVWIAVLVTLIAVYGKLRAASAFHARIFAIGATARVMFGAGFFLISYYEAPILEGLHTGRGFWILATDAEFYFTLAAEASHSGLGIIRDTDPSPLYLRAIAVWLDLAGVTPASVVLFNVLCYAGMVLLLSKICGSGRASTLAILAITASPALLVVGTQVLKDTLCVLLIVTAAAGVSLWANALNEHRSRKLASLIGGAGLICVSTYMFAGIRTYFAVLMLASLAATSVWAVFTAKGGAFRLRIATAYLLLVIATGLSAATGGGPYFDYYIGLTRLTLRQPDQPITALDEARARFIASGGNTNFGDEPLAWNRNSEGRKESIATRLRFLSIGVAAIFIPISLLRELSLVDFRGGRGILFITDVDTLMLDLALMVGVYLLVKRWPVLPLKPSTVFVLVLGVLTTVAMAYVITNFGTLFRLRLLAVSPLWLLPAFALSQAAPRQRISSPRAASQLLGTAPLR